MPSYTTDTVNACEPPADTLDNYQWQNARVRSVHNYDGTPPHRWRVQDAAGTHEFAADEWKMTVKFERRFVKGDHVALLPTWDHGVIDAIAKSSGRTEYWVRVDHDGSHATYYAEQMRRVGDAD